ncbi:MAG: lysophospholipid acyltransferase family protein [Cohaesibacteraceae bacterium]
MTTLLTSFRRFQRAFARETAYGAIRLLRAALRPLGLERASGLIGWSWRVFAPWTKRHPRALAQIEVSLPELDANQRERIVRAMWDGLGQTFAEGLLLDQLVAEPDRVTMESPEMVAAWQADEGKRGAIFVSMHSGNWEVFGLAASNAGMRIAGLYQSVQNARLEADLLQSREKIYSAGMISKGSHAMKRLFGLLRDGYGVGMLADQRQANRGVAVDFFGALAPSTPLPALLALRTDARLVVMRCKRIGRVRYTLEALELSVERTGDQDADVARVTQAIHSQFEAWIRERPEEWMWAHRRWSREVRRV